MSPGNSPVCPSRTPWRGPTFCGRARNWRGVFEGPNTRRFAIWTMFPFHWNSWPFPKPSRTCRWSTWFQLKTLWRFYNCQIFWLDGNSCSVLLSPSRTCLSLCQGSPGTAFLRSISFSDLRWKPISPQSAIVLAGKNSQSQSLETRMSISETNSNTKPCNPPRFLSFASWLLLLIKIFSIQQVPTRSWELFLSANTFFHIPFALFKCFPQRFPNL